MVNAEQFLRYVECFKITSYIFLFFLMCLFCKTEKSFFLLPKKGFCALPCLPTKICCCLSASHLYKTQQQSKKASSGLCLTLAIVCEKSFWLLYLNKRYLNIPFLQHILFEMYCQFSYIRYCTTDLRICSNVLFDKLV